MKSAEMQVMVNQLAKSEQRKRLLERRLMKLTAMMQNIQQQCEQLPEKDPMRETIELFIAGVTSVIDGSQDARVQAAPAGVIQ